MKTLTYLTFIFLLVACNSEQKTTVTHSDDYDKYLTTPALKTTSKTFELWNSKIDIDSTQLLSFGNVAGEYHRYFKGTGDITYLKKAEKALTKAVEIANINKESYARALARNYIAQHRFDEALGMAMLAEKLGGGKEDTQALIFDVHMELGNYQTAQGYLDKLKNPSSFGYLIRAAKWSDYKGDLDTTIHLMEKAMARAESSNVKSLMLWSYTNIADYYGHAGRIEDSYHYYLKALEINPQDAYAKKGIAWIVFSHEKNGKEALRILDSVTSNYNAPDYYLLKAEIAEFMGDTTRVVNNMDKYYAAVQNPKYGAMYDAYNVDFYLDYLNNTERALEISLEEVQHRRTPEAYSLLAKTYLKMNKEAKALAIVERNIIGKTYEPGILLNVAKVYKANDKFSEVKQLKKELVEAVYELGPLAEKEIETL